MATRLPPDGGGYKPSILEDGSLDGCYTCGLCQRIVRLACQTECGHQFCERCLTHCLHESPDGLPCPSCQTESEQVLISWDNHKSDYILRRSMDELHISCENRHAGCQWTGKLKIDKHLEICNFSEIHCPDCQQIGTKNKLQEHLAIICSGLNQNSLCKFGCLDLPKNVNLAAHDGEFFAYHVDVLYGLLIKLRGLCEVMDDMSRRLVVLRPDAETQTRHEDAPVSQQVAAASVATTDVVPPDDMSKAMHKMELSAKTSANLTNIATKEVQRVVARLVNLECRFQSEFSHDADGVLPGNLAEMSRLREQLAEGSVNYDGVLLWEITGFKAKCEQAKSGTPTSINSPVFYSSQRGYKLMARLYLDGDGTGTGAHISLFLVVLRGQFDGVLKWPLKELIRFTLLDQSGRRKHHTYTFCTDPSSASFRRPQQAVNVASGCPRFLPQQEFMQRYDHFIQEDTMMLEIRILHGLH